jgi:DNA-directed RNA polymerase specialized sigma24 family protein
MRKRWKTVKPASPDDETAIRVLDEISTTPTLNAVRFKYLQHVEQTLGMDYDDLRSEALIATWVAVQKHKTGSANLKTFTNNCVMNRLKSFAIASGTDKHKLIVYGTNSYNPYDVTTATPESRLIALEELAERLGVTPQVAHVYARFFK